MRHNNVISSQYQEYSSDFFKKKTCRNVFYGFVLDGYIFLQQGRTNLHNLNVNLAIPQAIAFRYTHTSE